MDCRKLLAAVGALAMLADSVAGQEKEMDSTADAGREARPAGCVAEPERDAAGRPKELAGREFLTDEEVAEFKKRAERLFDVTTTATFPAEIISFSPCSPTPIDTAARRRDRQCHRDDRTDHRKSHVAHRRSARRQNSPDDAGRAGEIRKNAAADRSRRATCIRTGRSQQRVALHHLRHAAHRHAEHQFCGPDGLLPDSANPGLCRHYARGHP